MRGLAAFPSMLQSPGCGTPSRAIIKWGFIGGIMGIMHKKMETTIMGYLGFRI